MFARMGRLLARLLGRFRPAGAAADLPGERLGPRSEHVARAFLERAGFSILAANYRCPMGELDLVADDAGTVVFVEVKARRLPDDPAAAARPEDAVHRRKQKKIGRCGRYFVRARKLQTRKVRFDVIAIDWSADDTATIRHHRAAFRPE